MHYPEQERTQKVLRHFHRELQRQYAVGKSSLELKIIREDGDYTYNP